MHAFPCCRSRSSCLFSAFPSKMLRVAHPDPLSNPLWFQYFPTTQDVSTRSTPATTISTCSILHALPAVPFQRTCTSSGQFRRPGRIHVASRAASHLQRGVHVFSWIVLGLGDAQTHERRHPRARNVRQTRRDGSQMGGAMAEALRLTFYLTFYLTLRLTAATGGRGRPIDDGRWMVRREAQNARWRDVEAVS